jgi:hypothetical protein
VNPFLYGIVRDRLTGVHNAIGTHCGENEVMGLHARLKSFFCSKERTSFSATGFFVVLRLFPLVAGAAFGARDAAPLELEATGAFSFFSFFFFSFLESHKIAVHRLDLSLHGGDPTCMHSIHQWVVILDTRGTRTVLFLL